MVRKIGVQFDENGEFVGDFLDGMELPEGHTVVPVEEVVGKYQYIPKLVDGVVVEKLTQEEIDEIVNAPKPETEQEKIKRLEQDSVALMVALTDVYEQLLALQTKEGV